MKYKKVGVLLIWIVKSNVSSVGHSLENGVNLYKRDNHVTENQAIETITNA